MVGAQGTEVGVIIVAHLPRVTHTTWPGEVTSQEVPQLVDVSHISSSPRRDIHPEGDAGRRPRNTGESDRCNPPTKTDTPPMAGISTIATNSPTSLCTAFVPEA
jgi:hypothetical protein